MSMRRAPCNGSTEASGACSLSLFKDISQEDHLVWLDLSTCNSIANK